MKNASSPLRKVARGLAFCLRASRSLLRQKKLFIIAALVVLVVILPQVSHAQVSGLGKSVIVIIGETVQFINQFLGSLLIAVIDVLVKVAQYNDFGDSQAVNIGWVVTRDLANMLFIVALIVISFGTVLQWEQYRYNRLLGKLVITAVLVNFSKSIALFFIDFSQVIMLTFVNAFRDVAAGNLTTGFGINGLLSYADSATSVDINIEATVMIFALSVILILVALAVVLSLVVILVRRIISLWIIIILSPIAFIASIMPGGVGSYNSQWWGRLGKEMFTGPVLAFFLWLSFAIIFIASNQGAGTTADIIDVGATDANTLQATASEIGSTRNLFNFISAIVLLVHSMSIASQAGGFAGKFASSISNKMDATGSRAIRGLANLGKGTALAPFKGARAGFQAAVGSGVGQSLLSTMQTTLPAQLGGNWATKRLAAAEARRSARVAKAGEKMNVANLTNEQLETSLQSRGFGRAHYARQVATTEELMKRNKVDKLSEKDLARYKQATGINYSLDAAGNVKKSFRSRRAQEKWESLSKLNPHMDFAGESDPRILTALETKAAERFGKLSPRQWGDLDEQAFDATDPTNKPGSAAALRALRAAYNDPTMTGERRAKIDENVSASLIAKIQAPGAGAGADAGAGAGAGGGGAGGGGRALPLMDVTDKKRRQFDRERKARERFGLASNSQQLDDMIQYARAKKNGIEPTGEEFRDVRSLVDKRVNEGESVDDVVKSLEDYKNDKERMSDVEYEEARKTLELYMKAEEEKGDVEAPALVGAESLDRRINAEINRAKSAGRSSVARLAVDFDKIGLRGAGAYASGDQKAPLIHDLEEIYRQQLTEEMTEARARVNQTLSQTDQELINQRVTTFGASLGKAEKLALVNTKRKGYSLGHVMRHENAHAEIENVETQTPEALEQIFNAMPAQDQKKVVDDYAKQLNIEPLPEAERKEIAMREYFTEGLANYGRTDTVGPTIDDSTALALKAAGANLRRGPVMPATQTPNQRELYDTLIRSKERLLKQKSDKLDQAFEEFITKHDLKNEQLLEDKALTLTSLENDLVQKELEEVWEVPKEDIQRIQRMAEDKIRTENDMKQTKQDFSAGRELETPLDQKN